MSVYPGEESLLLGTFDGALLPIQDVALHPTQPVLAIATGEYDGGWAYSGGLWIWNWRSGEVVNLLPRSRQVARCRWTSGDSLAALLYPFDEEDPGIDLDQVEAGEPYYGVEVQGVFESDDSSAGSLSSKVRFVPDLAELVPVPLRSEVLSPKGDVLLQGGGGGLDPGVSTFDSKVMRRISSHDGRRVIVPTRLRP